MSNLTENQKQRLQQIARDSIRHYIEEGDIISVKEDDAVLKEKRGVFVTLKKHGQLRGCIGSFLADKPLYKAVRDMAVESALRDPRFPPVKSAEVDELSIELSVLSPLREIKTIDEIEIGKHGIYISKGYNRGVLLPQVAVDNGWDRLTFLKRTCWKAGLPENAWQQGAKIQVFSAEIIEE